MTALPSRTVAGMVALYREIRRRVWADATRSPSTSAADHRANQSFFRTAVTTICDRARLDRYVGNDDAAAQLLWHELWTKIRYAGIRAQIASDEIASLEQNPGSFDDFRRFVSAEWTVSGSVRGMDYDPATTGRTARAFLEKTGMYEGRALVANVSKLKKTVAVARALASFRRTHPEAPVLEFVTGRHNDPWLVAEHLDSTGYSGGLTGLHLLMDLGFPFVKPDIVLTSLLLKWGWLHKADSTLPKQLQQADLQGRGALGSRFVYTHPRMYRVAIDIARQVADAVSVNDLRRDIGWCTKNPLRELDLFFVKAGQRPERQFGVASQIERLEDGRAASIACATKRPR